jgi:NADH-quinone oxidoreductase subunit L
LIVGPTHIFSGWLSSAVGSISEELHAFHWGLAGASALAAIVGIAAAAAMYAQPSDLPGRLRTLMGPLYTLSLRKFYLDELAYGLVVAPLNALTFLFVEIDMGVVDRLVDWAGEVPAAVGRFFRPVQNGLIQSYALVMLFGLAIFLTTIAQVLMVSTP